MTNVAHAEPYKPGSVGYIYDHCVAALKDSTTPREFLDTYCGGFVEGYGMGVMVANGVTLGEPNELDPCKEEKKKEYARINARLCKNLPDYRDSKTPPGTVLKTATDIVSRWRDFLKTQEKLGTLKQPAIKEINAMITPGKFCDTLGKNAVKPSAPFVINPALLNANWYDFVRAKPMTLATKYAQCKADLKKIPFNETRCAAEVTGFMTGLYSTAHLQKRPAVKGPCKKTIDRLYDGLDMTGKLCLTPATNPAKPAQIFLERMDALKKEGESLSTSGFGAVGYQSIYYGLLCNAP